MMANTGYDGFGGGSNQNNNGGT